MIYLISKMLWLNENLQRSINFAGRIKVCGDFRF